MKRLLIDCTATYRTGLNTGIQRVVRRLLEEMTNIHEAAEYEVVPVVFEKGRLYRLPHIDLLAPCNKNRNRPGMGTLRILARKYRAKLAESSRTTKIFGDLLIGGGAKAWGWGYRLIRKETSEFGTHPFKILAEDHLVLLDAFWGFGITEALVRGQLGQKLARISTVIYDVIPLRLPEFFDRKTAESFRQALETIAPVTDNFLCISESVMHETREILLQMGLANERHQFDFFSLGFDHIGGSPRRRRNNGHRAISAAFSSSDTWLMVGTIEPRKNHLTVLKAFERIWEIRPETHLVFIGRVGWNTEKIMPAIERHPEFGSRFFLLTDVDDDQLECCYKRAKGLVMASFAEGFGLPVVEALNRNLRVVCSDLPVFREIAGAAPVYFNPRNVDDLVTALRTASDPEFSSSRGSATAHAFTWKDSSRMFLKKVTEFPTAGHPPRPQK